MQKIKSLWERFQKFIKQLNSKKILLTVGCILLILLPTILALFYVQYHNYTFHSDEFTVTLYDPDGTELVSESENPEKAASGSMVEIFYRLQSEKSPLSKPSGSFNEDTFVLAKILLNGTPSELKCYFSKAESQGYCIDQTGKLYSIPAEINQAFLLSQYSELFYDNAKIPTLVTLDGDRILPFSTEWYYQLVDSKDYLLSQRNETELEHTLYEITGAIGIQFDTPPDECDVSVYKNKKLYRNCTLEELSSISADAGTRFTIDVQATWQKEDCYGTVLYSFDAEIRNPSTFSVNTSTVKAGDVVLFTCTNVSDPSKIKFHSNEAIFEPIFEWDSATSAIYGILPIPQNTKLESLQFDLSYGATTKSFEITIEPTTSEVHKNLDWDIPDKLLRFPLFENDFYEILATKDSVSKLHYFRGNFSDPQNEGFTVQYYHGDVLEINGHNFIPHGTEFVIDQPNDARVNAWNHGVVLATGSNSSIGRFVIIDHGCGLRTIYGALGSIDVEVGEIVQKGERIGSTSTETRSGKNGFLVFCTVGTTQIHPIYLMERELKFSK